MQAYLDLIRYKVYAELSAEAARTFLGILWWLLVRHTEPPGAEHSHAEVARILHHLEESAAGREIYAWLIGSLVGLLFLESWLSWKVGS